MGDQGFGLDPDTLLRVAQDIVDVHKQGVQIAIVIGGGNIFRGISGVSQGLDRSTADYMGMLATVMNALALRNALESLGGAARVMSALHMSSVCEPYIHGKALRHLRKHRILIFAAGSGNPFFTTDTAAALRASEMKCQVLLKGTKVDGVYSADPAKDEGATFYPHLTYHQVLSQNLKVMDAAAIALAQEGNVPVEVFSILKPQSLERLLQGKGKFTHISNDRPD